MKVKPLGDRILVQRVQAEAKTAGGIYLPESAQEKPQEAKVLAVGEGKVNENTGRRETPDVKKGDVVLLSKWGGTEIKIEGEDYLIINQDDVLGVVE
jgi:chaperonin GroES